MIFQTKIQPKLIIATLVMAMMGLTAGTGHSQGITHLQSMFSRKAPSEGKGDTKKTATNDNLGPSVQEIHRLATQMAWQIGWEISSDKEAATKELSTIHYEMRKHSTVTAKLLKSYQSDSAKNFESAAVEVRKSVAELKKLCDKTEVSKNVAEMLKRSEPISTFISEKRGSFKPQQ